MINFDEKEDRELGKQENFNRNKVQLNKRTRFES